MKFSVLNLHKKKKLRNKKKRLVIPFLFWENLRQKHFFFKIRKYTKFQTPLQKRIDGVKNVQKKAPKMTQIMQKQTSTIRVLMQI